MTAEPHLRWHPVVTVLPLVLTKQCTGIEVRMPDEDRVVIRRDSEAGPNPREWIAIALTRQGNTVQHLYDPKTLAAATVPHMTFHAIERTWLARYAPDTLTRGQEPDGQIRP